MKPLHLVALVASVLVCSAGSPHARPRGVDAVDRAAGEAAVRATPPGAERNKLRGGYSAHNVLGLPVRATNAEHVGTVSDIALARSGRVLALLITTPEKTVLRVPWENAAVDLPHARVTLSAPLAQLNASRAQTEDPNGAAGEVQILVRRLLSSTASRSGGTYTDRIDDIVLSRHGCAAALVVTAKSRDAPPAQFAYAFPSRFAYDAARGELVMSPQQRRVRSLAFRYADFGIRPPAMRPNQSNLARAGTAPSRASGAPAVVLPAALSHTAADGCWARMYSDPSYQGTPLTLVGPISMPALRDDWGFDWDPQYESLMVGPDATLTLYANRGYHQKTATFTPNQRIVNLDATMGIFRSVRSLMLGCSERGR